MVSSKDPNEYMVYAGDVDIEGDGVIHTIAQIIIHPDYINDGTTHNRNNIALIEVSFILSIQRIVINICMF